MLRLVFISDTHGYHKSLNIPQCDLLICSGDLSFRGEIEIFKSFDEWIKNLKDNKTIRECIVIPGNHDLSTDPKFLRYYQPNFRDFFQNSKLLIDQSFQFEELNIYGSPQTPEFCGWGHSYSNSREANQIWSKIPDNTNLLITHGPPYSILDAVYYDQRNVGCMELYLKVTQLNNLAVHSFGHIHEQYGFKKVGDTLFINASSCTLKYHPYNKPIVADLSLVEGRWEVKIIEDFL